MTLDPGIFLTGSFFATALLDFRDTSANGLHKYLLKKVSLIKPVR